MNEIRADLNVSPGTPLDIFLVNPLAALLPSLDEKLEEKYEISSDDRANLLLTSRSDGENSQFLLRLYFTSPTDLSYGADQMSLKDGSGYDFGNLYAVGVSSSEMALYTYEDYYYTDVTVYGETQFTTSSSIEWEDAPDSYSHLLVVSITNSGALAETDDALDDRVSKEIALRNVVTNPGAEAWFFDNYPDNMRDTLAVGYGDTKMARDVNTTLGANIGGMIDIYTKEDLPSDLTLKKTIDLLTSRTWSRTVSVAFMQEDAATGDMYEDTWHKNMVSGTVSVESIVRSVTVPFTTTDYSIDIVTGIITCVDATTTIRCDKDASPHVKLTGWNNTSGDARSIDTGLFVASDLDNDMFVILTNGTDTETYMIISFDIAGQTITLDRDVIDDLGSGSTEGWRREPVSIDFDYNPMGVELEEFDNPLMWINSVTVLDPLTDEPLDPLTLISRKEGYGAGTYGSGPYGFGSTEGWLLHVDDENYRYSIDETGVLEFQGNYLGDRVEISYKTSTRMAAFQTGMDSNRSLAADVLVKTFVPVGVTLAVDVDGDTGVTDITGLDSYIWGLSGTMELSDIVSELYDLGATYVDLEDLKDQMTIEQWNIDGTFSNITIPDSGQISLSDPTARLLPVSITVNVS